MGEAADREFDARPLNFIRDEPAEQDSFKSHSRLANAVAAAIKGQADLKVIGLLGPWGSGKSTVIRFIRANLAESTDGDKIYCFSYDAWLQQNDPPKRAFLEALLHFLIEQGLTNSPRWKTRIGQLTGRIEDTETTTTPSLTLAGRFILASLFLVPLGVPLIGFDTIDAAWGRHPSRLAWLTFVIGLILTLSPALCALVIYLLWRPKGWPFSSTTWTEHKPPHEGQSIISIYISKAVHTVRNRILRSPDPTTIEFQDLFREIMDDVSNKERRFIFIIDNLDRVPEEDAIAMWGTIRSLFLGSTETQAVRKHGSQPTVILPIDSGAVQRMYKLRHVDDAVDLATSFMDKTFDLTFRVPKPVMSDWKTYLRKQFRYVFGDLATDDLVHVTNSFYEEYLQRSRSPITPRGINNLINSIGTLWLQWRVDGIELTSIAYYAVYRDEIESDITTAVTQPRAGIAEIDPNWQKSISAIYYGVDPEVAVQVLIEQELRDAIINFDQTGFNQYASVPGFDTVAQHVIDSPPEIGTPLAPDPIFLGNAARLLDVADPPTGASLTALWRNLCASQIKAHIWQVLNPDVEAAVATFLKRCEPTKLEAFIRSVSAKLGAIDGAALADAATRSSFVGIGKLLTSTAKAAGLKAVTITVPGQPDAYLLVLALCGNDTELMKQIQTKAPIAELVKTLSVNLGVAQSAASVDEQVVAMIARGTPAVWDELISSARLIAETPSATPFSIGPALAVLGRFRGSVKGLLGQIKVLADGGHLYQRLNESYLSKDNTAASRALSLLLLSDVEFTAPSGTTWESLFSERPEILAEIDTAIHDYDPDQGTTDIVKSATSHPSAMPLVRALVSKRVKEGRLGHISIPDFIENLATYMSCVDPDSQVQFIVRVSRYELFEQDMQEADFDGNSLVIFHAIVGENGATSPAIAELLKVRLAEATAPQWKSALENNSEPLAIAISYNDHVAPLRLGAGLDSALRDLTDDIVISNDQELRDRWFLAVQFLSDAARVTQLKFVRDKMINGNPVSEPVALLSAAGGILVSKGGFEERPDDAVRYLIRELIAEPTAETWLVENAESLRIWVSKSFEATQDDLSERLAEVWGASSGERKDQMETLRRTWKLPEFELPAAESTDENPQIATVAPPDTKA